MHGCTVHGFCVPCNRAPYNRAPYNRTSDMQEKWWERAIVAFQQRQGQLIDLLFVFLIGWYFVAWLGWTRYPFRGISAWEAIPATTGLVLETHSAAQAQATWRSAPYGQTLGAMDLLQRWQGDLLAIDSLLSRDSTCSDLVETAHILSSAQNDGAKAIFWLWVLEDYRPDFSLARWIERAQAQNQQQSVFRGTTIHQLDFGNQQRWAVASYRGLLLMSRLTAAVESAIAQLDELASGMPRQGAFRSLRSELNDPALRAYIQFEGLPMLLSTLTQSVAGQVAALSQTGTWAGFNLSLDSNQVAPVWKGVWQPKGDFWNALADATPPAQSTIGKLLPDNIASLAYLGIQDYPAFYQGIKTEENPDFEHHILNWMGSELAYFCTEPTSTDFSDTRFVLLQARNAEEAERSLASHGERFGILHKSEYQGHSIVQLAAKDLLRPIWGDALNPIQNPYYTLIEDYIIFTNSLTSLELYIEKINFNKQNTAPNPASPAAGIAQTNLFLWLHPQRAYPFAKSYVREERQAVLEAAWKQLRHLTPISMRAFGHGGQLECQLSTLYTANTSDPIIIKKDSTQTPIPTTSEGVEVAWRCELKKEVLLPPLAVQSPHNAKELDILVQDQDWVLYRLDFDGKIVWEKKLPEAILTGVQTLDYRGNGEWQYVFNTKKTIYILDRQGNELKQIALIAPAAAGLSLLRYEYGERIIVPCTNGDLYGYDKNGKPWTGWNPMKSVGKQTLPIRHASHKKQPYFWMVNNTGAIRAARFDGQFHFAPLRMGEAPTRIGVDTSIGRVAVGGVSGKIWVANVTGKSFTLGVVPKLKTPVRFEYADWVGDARKDYARCDGTTLVVHAYDEKQKFKEYWRYVYAAPQDEIFATALPNGDKQGIGSVERASQRISLIDAQGKLYAGFPLVGSTPFWITQPLDGSSALLVVANGNQVYAYRVR